MSIHKLLIANRGEIARRIIRHCREQQIKSVAIYSSVDQQALHTLEADEAYPVGFAPSHESYLNIERIIEVAKLAKVDAIHPGYGFLSENPAFAEACIKAGIIFVGPSADVIRSMGNKSLAKALMKKHQIPTLETFSDKNADDSSYVKAATKLGFPLLIKAALGGGGKGMRIVHQPSELKDAIKSAKREAKNHFGSDDILLEPYIEKSRHIEVQIIGDQHGSIFHLFERDCSIQRRYQKIIEEAPAPFLKPKTRKQVQETAINVAKLLNYTNAGTVEFIMDEQENFYFLEMNTRLQVEHPVTEMITKMDLVGLQIQVAEGKKLEIKQDDIKVYGHSIEARIYAEDPVDFLPSSGTIEHLYMPTSEHIRIDGCIAQGTEISAFYDAMIAKIISFGEDRDTAIHRLRQYLKTFKLCGITTNRKLLIDTLESHDFQHTTHTKILESIESNHDEVLEISFILAAISTLHERQTTCSSPWHSGSAWQSLLPITHSIKLQHKQLIKTFQCIEVAKYQYDLYVEDKCINVALLNHKNNEMVCFMNSQHYRFNYMIDSHHNLYIDYAHDIKPFEEITLKFMTQPHQTNELHLYAPLPGTVVDIRVNMGDEIQIGEPLMVLEAMKMEHTIKAPLNGVVKSIFFAMGAQVSEGAELIELDTVD